MAGFGVMEVVANLGMRTQPYRGTYKFISPRSVWLVVILPVL